MVDEPRQAQGLERIVSCVPRELLPRELLGRALAVATRCREAENRAAALAAVIPRLPDDLLEPAADAVLDLMRSGPDVSLDPMIALVARLPRELRDELRRRQSWI